MARYKWDSPGDWLGDKINAYRDTLDDFILRGKGTADEADKAHAELVIIANTIVNGTLNVDSDDIQDAFQDEMDENGYFCDLDEPDKDREDEEGDPGTTEEATNS